MVELNNQSSKNYLYTVRAMYLGDEPMGELLEGENGSDAIQVPLKRTILRTQGAGEEVELVMTNDSLQIKFLNKRKLKKSSDNLNEPNIYDNNSCIILPIDLLAYCGALRQLPSSKIKDREFETLDKALPLTNNNDPPLFVTIFRNFDSENTLYCHSFVMRKDDEAMELVKLVMEIYYNLIRLQELEENSNNDDSASLISSNSVDKFQSSQSKLTNEILKNKEKEKQLNNEHNQKEDKKYGQNKETTNFPINNLAERNSNSSLISNINKTNNQIPININVNPKNNLNSNSTNLIKNNYSNSNQNINNSINNNTISNAVGNSNNVNNNTNSSKNISVYTNENKANSNNIVSTETQYNELLEIYNKIPVTDKNNITNKNTQNKTGEIVSANEIIKNSLDSYETELNKNNSDLKNLDSDINDDKNPIIIRKPNNEQIVYKQNVFIRWLQPPTPPPPAPIIIREVQEQSQEQLPPLIIYKQAPRPETPPPLVIRERPPTPIDHSNDPLIIERRIPASAESRQRKVIIEHLPAPPPKPRDIILEKWLPKEPQTRTVYYQKAYNTTPQSPQVIYECMPEYSSRSTNKNFYKQLANSKRCMSNEIIYAPASNHIYSSKNSTTSFPSEALQGNSKVAGYRIIRQIIPGPNSTTADIEKALARSQRVSTTYSNQHRLYSPSHYETHNSSVYSQVPNQPSVYGSIDPRKAYSPHNYYSKKEIYRSNSIDNL